MNSHSISSLDLNFFAVDSETTPQTIGGVLELDGAISAELLRSRLNSVVELFPRLRFFVDTKAGLWKQDHQFSVDRHFTIHSQSKDPDLTFAALLSSRLPTDRPLWQLAVLPSPTSGKTTLLFTFHHSFTDGIGALAFIFSLFDEDRARSKEGTVKLTNVFDRLPTKIAPLRLFPRLSRLFKDLRAKRDGSPLVGRNSTRREFLRFEIPISAIKEKRLSLGCASNDMILAALCFALRNYCMRKSTAASLDNIRAIIPFNRRTAGELCSFSNHLAGMGVLLPLKASTLVQMAGHLGSQLTAAKFSGEYGAYGLLAKLNSFLPEFARRRVAYAAARRTSLICTNMPGPRTALYLDGAMLTSCYGSAALMPGHGSALSFINMRDKICCSLLTDPAIIPIGRLIADEFQRVFNTSSEHPDSAKG